MISWLLGLLAWLLLLLGSSGAEMVSTVPDAPDRGEVAMSGIAPSESALSAAGGVDTYVSAICSYTWNCDRAVRVFECESRLNPLAVGALGEAGISQIHPIHAARVGKMGYSWEEMFKVGPNLDVAHSIWLEQGWNPWACRHVLS